VSNGWRMWRSMADGPGRHGGRVAFAQADDAWATGLGPHDIARRDLEHNNDECRGLSAPGSGSGSDRRHRLRPVEPPRVTAPTHGGAPGR
jgi:hypothetical protein